jgi:hypothetical protein
VIRHAIEVIKKPKRDASQVVLSGFDATQHLTEPSTNVELLQEDELRRGYRHLSCS